jgi:membrane-associated phospholipid phosphatase
MHLLTLMLTVLLATPALAEEPTRSIAEEPNTPDESAASTSLDLPTSFDHPLAVRLDVDLPIFFATALPGAFFATGLISPDSPGYIPTSRDLNPLDRSALDTLRPDISRASDIAWITMMALPMVDHLIESAVESKKTGKHFGRRFGSDLVVYGEAMAVNALVTELIKFTAQRPRPLSYLDPADVQDADLRQELIERQARPDSSKSFVSGHTSASFTAAVTWSMLMTLKHPDRPVPLALLWGGTVAGASAVGVLRVVAAKHHPTDVIAGAILGTAIGILTPLAHKRKGGAPFVVAPMIDGEHRGAMIVGLLP